MLTSTPLDDDTPPKSTVKIDATMAAARADFDAKMAELMADLEGARSEKEKTDTELAYLKVLNRYAGKTAHETRSNPKGSGIECVIAHFRSNSHL